MSRPKSKEMDLTVGNPFWSLLKFAIPVILGNLFQLFYTLADSVIVGKTLGADSLAAVGATSIIIYFVFCFINGFTGGFGICLGQRCGAKDEKGMRKSVAVSTLLSIIFTIVLTLICCLLAHQILRWMQIPEDISSEAYDYMFVVLLGTGATVFYNMISNMLRALGDSKTPLYFLVFSSVLNIFLDILFIVPFHMGVAGAAWATILSEFASMFLCAVQLAREESILHISWTHLSLDFENLKQICIYGLPTGLQGCVIDFANVMIQSYINSFGAAAIAGIGAYSKVEGFIFLPEISFSMALTTFVSQNEGAGQKERSRKGILFGLAAALLMIECLGILIYLFAPTFISFFNQNPEVIAIGVDRARICAFFYVLLGFSHVVSSILRGLGRPVMPMVVMLVCWCAVRVVVLMTMGQSIHSLYLTHWLYPITWGLSSIVYVFDLRKYKLFTPREQLS